MKPINQIGFREILDGSEFDAYFPKSECEIVETVPGIGKKGRLLIIKWILKYRYQAKKISKTLKRNC